MSRHVDDLTDRDRHRHLFTSCRPRNPEEQQRGARVRQLRSTPAAHQRANTDHQGHCRRCPERDRRQLPPPERPQPHPGCHRGRRHPQRRDTTTADLDHQADQDDRGQRPVEEPRGDGEAIAAEPAQQHRVQRADQDHRKACAQHHARRQPPPCRCTGTSVRPSGPTDRDHRRHGGSNRQQRQGPADGTSLGEGMDRRCRPGARKRRAEQGQQERERHGGSAPPRFTAAADVQPNGHRQPRQQGGVLDRIPRPVPAPPQLRVRPVRAEDHAETEQRPRAHQPWLDPGPPEPLLPHRRQPESERGRDDQDRQAGVDHGRVHPHRPVLEDRGQAHPVQRRDLQPGKRVCQPLRDGRQGGDDRTGHRHRPQGWPATQSDDGEHRRHGREQQQRPGHAAPQAHHAVVRPERLPAVVRHGDERVITDREGPSEDAQGCDQRRGGNPGRPHRGPCAPAGAHGDESQQRSHGCSTESSGDQGPTDVAHGRTVHGSSASGPACVAADASPLQSVGSALRRASATEGSVVALLSGTLESLAATERGS